MFLLQKLIALIDALVSIWKQIKLLLIDLMLGKILLYQISFFIAFIYVIVLNFFSMLPTTELIDTAKMPLCSYSVRRGSVNGPIV